MPVSLRDVHKRYGALDAVNGVGLDIDDGRFFAFLGPSGCGKTTTLKMIGGFEQPTSGDIAIDGESVVGLPPYQRPTNMVFQSYALFPHLNVRDNVAFGLRMRRVAKRDRRIRAEAALERVRLSGYGGRAVAELSGGEQQRVALARALVNEPKVLLLDEPLGALDLKLRRAMQDELKAIQRDAGISFVYVTHDQEEALSMADRLAVMHDGRLLQTGTPSEIYDRPTTRFVADFVGMSSFLAAEVTARQNGSAALALADGTRLAAPARDCVDPAARRVTAMVRPEHVVLRDAGASSPDGFNGIRVTVEDRHYAGSDLYCLARAKTGERVTARLPGAAPAAEPGTDFLATFAVADTVLLVDD